MLVEVSVGIGVVSATLASLSTLAVLRQRRSSRVVARVVIDYRDAFGEGEWCAFSTVREADEAVDALNAVYEGKKEFWIQEASLRTVPGYLGSVPVSEWHGPLPPARPAPKARPKPGTPIVRQSPSGNWTVTAGAFTIGYGRGEEGYRAALAAVERAHRPVS